MTVIWFMHTDIPESIQAIGEEREKQAVDTPLDLLVEDEDYVYNFSFSQNLENLRKVLTHPLHGHHHRREGGGGRSPTRGLWHLPKGSGIHSGKALNATLPHQPPRS
jgi:hypothetical protein